MPRRGTSRHDCCTPDLLGLKHELDGAPARPASTAPSATNVRRQSVRFKSLIAASAVAALAAAWFASGLLRRGQHVPPPEAVVRYDRGTSAIREGAYFQASKALERALEIDNAFVLARARRAEAYSGDGTHRQGQGGIAAGHGAAPGSLESIGRRVELSWTRSRRLSAATSRRQSEYSLIVNVVRDGKAAAYVDLAQPMRKTRISIEPSNGT